MSDNEIETILREIRNRVYLQQIEQPPTAPQKSNGTGAETSDQLMSLRAHAATLQRAWNSLPPIVSNRRGAAAKFELWIKRQVGGLMRWFTWEQVNFNAAVHSSMLEIAGQLEQQHDAISSVRTLAESVKAALEKLPQLESALMQVRVQFEQQSAELRRLWNVIEQTNDELAKVHSRAVGAMTELERAMRENNDRITEEQRVCFKQLSLEASETAVLLDRVRREVVSREATMDRSSQ
ncbi:MAG: hypothetical protein ABR555_12610 [Pyrinomonadaceae bacterium]